MFFTATAHAQTQSIVPGARWDSIAVDSKWSRDSLRRIGAMVDSIGSGAVVVVDDGLVVASWGNASRKFPITSVRKSLLHALLGIEVARAAANLPNVPGS